MTSYLECYNRICDMVTVASSQPDSFEKVLLDLPEVQQLVVDYICPGMQLPSSKDRENLEQLQVQLAGCSSAACGFTKEVATKGMYGWSPSYQDTLDLRLKYDKVLEVLKYMVEWNEDYKRVNNLSGDPGCFQWAKEVLEQQ